MIARWLLKRRFILGALVFIEAGLRAYLRVKKRKQVDR
jgi:hypothetical protein